MHFYATQIELTTSAPYATLCLRHVAYPFRQQQNPAVYCSTTHSALRWQYRQSRSNCIYQARMLTIVNFVSVS